MNKNILIRRIKRDIGIYGIALPIDDLDNAILKILEDTTVPVFSIYCPHEEKFSIDIYDLSKDISTGAADLYIIPDSFLIGRDLLYVTEVKYDESFLCQSYYPSYLSTSYQDDLFGNTMLANTQKQLGDAMINSLTFKYLYPRKLFIYDQLMSSKLSITGQFTHDINLQTISPTQQESFYNLAILDVKAGLYNTVKHYDGLETAYGRIELKIDDWQNAKDERKELLSQWDDTYLLDLVGNNYN